MKVRPKYWASLDREIINNDFMSDRKTRFIADRFVPLRSASVDSSYLSSAKT